MKVKLIISLIALLCGVTVRAQTETLFKEGFSFDLFGAYSVPQPGGIGDTLKTDLGHGKFGAGLGVNYFFTENFGLGADALVSPVDDIGGSFIDQASASAIARLPLGRFAPYGLGGYTRSFETDEWSPHAAIGVEARFTEKFGAGIESRYQFLKDCDDSLQFRVFLRFNL